jgi:hypothetical protein
MSRRLYFLFPDEVHARRVVNEMQGLGVGEKHMHAIAREDIVLKTLPQATARQRRDTGWVLERTLWNGNLVLFALALLGLGTTLFLGLSAWSILALAVMITTFVAGALFTTRVPNVHLREFTDALAHGEVLLMVDVPRRRVAEIEDWVHRRHPEAAGGGVGWTIEALGI